ncbi:unnamed protein product [Vitrella brassicaformis CCMP3155]|uniref:U-box domain-containing protein n=2 Tax=Vitrella brassicaformis TaxID=1169539 RepID=A0A0G4FPP9_VITBC|nr:unnamed protein product [Vitrella brassicaformis CCMP3155]|eukprot:CEM15989.1 unnamed protein product [Vitrella brassicaformis CCMP3155]
MASVFQLSIPCVEATLHAWTNDISSSVPSFVPRCALTGSIPSRPCMTRNNTYDAPAIEDYINTCGSSPMTSMPLKLSDLRPDHTARRVIQCWAVEEMGKQGIATSYAPPGFPNVAGPWQPSRDHGSEAVVSPAVRRRLMGDEWVSPEPYGYPAEFGGKGGKGGEGLLGPVPTRGLTGDGAGLLGPAPAKDTKEDGKAGVSVGDGFSPAAEELHGMHHNHNSFNKGRSIRQGRHKGATLAAKHPMYQHQQHKHNTHIQDANRSAPAAPPFGSLFGGGGKESKAAGAGGGGGGIFGSAAGGSGSGCSSAGVGSSISSIFGEGVSLSSIAVPTVFRFTGADTQGGSGAALNGMQNGTT